MSSLNTSASSSRVQLPPVDHVVTGTDLDSEKLLRLTLVRETGKPLGLILSNFVNKSNRSVSRSGSDKSKSRDVEVSETTLKELKRHYTSLSKSKSKKSQKKSTLPMIVAVEADSRADLAGLKASDLVIEINGKATIGESNEKVRDWVKDSGNTIEFTVRREKKAHSVLLSSLAALTQLAALGADERTEDPVDLKAKDSIISAEIPAKKASRAKEPGDVLPRLCRLSRNDRNDQYGFDFKTLKSDGMHVAKNVRDGLPAAVAGLREGDYILEVNGESIDGIEHEQVAKKISARSTMVDLLAVNDLNAYLNHKNDLKNQSDDDVSIAHGQSTEGHELVRF